MKQFAEAYPVSVLYSFIKIEEELKNMKVISQQAVAKLLSIKNEEDANTLQVDAYSREEIFLQSIIFRISWSHHIILRNKVKNPGQRFWYMLHVLEHGISRNLLGMQIESGLFERQVKAKKINNFPVPPDQGLQTAG